MNAYEKLTPEEIEQIVSKSPVAYCPWGAIEWHGRHLPLGVDGLLADRFCEELATRFGGLKLPCMWLPISTLTHPYSICFEESCVVSVARQTIRSLRRIGCRAICLVTGHYAQGHLIELYQLALEEMRADPQTLVLATTPLDLLDDPDLLDHAGKSETAQMLHYHPELVHLDRYVASDRIRESAVIGQDPRLADASLAEIWFDDAIKAWGNVLNAWLAKPEPPQIASFYENRLAMYEPYRTRYYTTSWEDALGKWLDEKDGL